jgi:hypothetical protein
MSDLGLLSFYLGIKVL